MFSADQFRGICVRHEWSEKDMTFVRRVMDKLSASEQSVPPLWLINLVEGSRVVPSAYPAPVHTDGCTEWACVAHGHQLVKVHIEPVFFEFVAGSFRRRRFRGLQTSIQIVPRCVGPAPPIIEKATVPAINSSSTPTTMVTPSQPFHGHSYDVVALNNHCRKKNQYFHSIHKRKHHDTQARSKPKNSHRKLRARSRLIEANATVVDDDETEREWYPDDFDQTWACHDDRDDYRDKAWESLRERLYEQQYWDDYHRAGWP